VLAGAGAVLAGAGAVVLVAAAAVAAVTLLHGSGGKGTASGGTSSAASVSASAGTADTADSSAPASSAVASSAPASWTPASSAPASSAPASASGSALSAVPADYLGRWRGTLTENNGLQGPQTADLKITGGAVNAIVGTSSYTSGGCAYNLRLVCSTMTQVELHEEVTAGRTSPGRWRNADPVRAVSGWGKVWLEVRRGPGTVAPDNGP
jgi:hypothetical protein